MLDKSIKAVLCDIGGVLYVGNTPIKGSIDAIKRVKQHYPIRFLTNTTQKTSTQVLQNLLKLGFDVKANEILTALDLTKIFLENEKSSGEYLLTNDAKEFFTSLDGYEKKYVVVGDAQDNFTYKNLNLAFRTLQDNAKLIAIAKNRYFKDDDNKLSMDAGCFVSALEYASGQKAKIIGKPSKDFYLLACKSLGYSVDECVMIGDDIESDIKGAKDAGLETVLVKTGKFNENDLHQSIKPDYVIDSIADI